jgi:hypothetical protein
MGFTTANERWPSLNRQKAGLPNGDGMRPYVATRRTPAGQHAWVIQAGAGHHGGSCREAPGETWISLRRAFTDSAVAAGCGVRRWDGYTMHDDWHLDRVVSAIGSAAQAPSEPAVADALAAAIAKREGRERVLARRREQDLAEAARRQEEVAVMSALGVELRELRDTDPAHCGGIPHL